MAHLAPCGTGGGGHESGLPTGCEEDCSETSQDGLVEEMGSLARVQGVERRSVVGADPSCAAKIDQ